MNTKNDTLSSDERAKAETVLMAMFEGEYWIRASDVQKLVKQHAEIMAALQKDRDEWMQLASALEVDPS